MLLIETFTGNEVAKLLTQVKVTMREAEIKLDETDFDERKLINKRKNLILQGKDPDMIERKLKRLQKEMEKKKLDNKRFLKNQSQSVSKPPKLN